ncbi:MAG: hypothetical protein AAF799_10950 [Myxococcota bacterium]
MQQRTCILPCALVLVTIAGCTTEGDTALPTTPPTHVELVADSGFRHAGAVAASPDGQTFYTTAYDDDDRPGIFAIDAESGSVTALHVGEPLLYPTDLTLSCDGGTLYVSDQGIGSSDTEFGDPTTPTDTTGGIHTLSTAGGSIATLAAHGISRAAGVVLDPECETLYITGDTEMFRPALFTVPVGGGSATIVHEGAPLVSPTGLHVDADQIAWVMDHGARNEQGEGLLFSISLDGEVGEVVGGLGMGRHGGVSLVPGGTTAVIPVRDERGQSQLLTANTATGEVSSLPTPDITHPTGVASARNAPVMVVAGEQSISIATFEP